MSQITRKFITVLLVRNELEKTPLVVLPHEVPILEALHPSAEVRKIDVPTPHGLDKKTFDVEEEYANLQEKYRGPGDAPNPTVAVFRNLDEFKAAFGGRKDEDLEDDEQSDFDGGENGDGTEQEAKLAEAKSLGIKANKTWGIEKLQAAIDAELAK